MNNPNSRLTSHVSRFRNQPSEKITILPHTNTTMNEHTCKNCENTFTASYCNVCGQKLAHRISMKHIWHDIVHAFTHADKGIFHLFFQLFIRPGIVAREYIVDGKRKRYFNPFQYILIVGSIAAFVAVNSHFMENTMTMMPGAEQASGRQAEFMKTAAHLQSKYFNLVILLLLPFNAFATFIWYRRLRFNYAEHLTLHTFIGAQTSVFGMLMMFVVSAAGKQGLYIFSVMSVVSMLFQIFACKQFFNLPGFKGVLRATVSVLTAFIFFFVFAAIATSVAMFIFIMATKK